ncbi:MAG: alkaline phosphatase family protein, partial [Phototrophicaceae bacterium]
LRQFSLLANMLFFRPAGLRLPNGTLVEWGLEPEKLLPEPALAEALAQVGVPTHLVLAHAFKGTGLSRIMHRGVEHHHSHLGTADMWLRLRDVLRQTAGQRCYVHAYWPVVDMLSHVYGAHAEYIHNEVIIQLRALRDVLRSEDVRDGRTLVMVIADHGHADVHHLIDMSMQQNGRVAPLLETLRLTYGGDTRLAHLFLRDGCRQRAVEVLRADFAGSLAAMDPAQAVEAGLYGPGPVHPELFARLGDLLVLARQSYRLVNDESKANIVSMHGGMSDREMLVPLLWRRI